jgi:hypothetical protein
MSIPTTPLLATVRVLVRNLESDTRRLQFSDFYIQEIADLTPCRIFPHPTPSIKVLS